MSALTKLEDEQDCNIPRLRSYSICQLSKMSRPSNVGSPPVAEDAIPMLMSYPTMRSSSEKYIVASSLKYSAPPPMPPTSARLPSLSRGISRLIESFECRQVESAPVSNRNITGPDMFNRGIATTPWIKGLPRTSNPPTITGYRPLCQCRGIPPSLLRR